MSEPSLPWTLVEGLHDQMMIVDGKRRIVASETGIAETDLQRIVASVNRVPELEQALRKARLAMRAALRTPPHLDFLASVVEEIDALLPGGARLACAGELLRAGLPAPRTCAICGLGPCASGEIPAKPQ